MASACQVVALRDASTAGPEAVAAALAAAKQLQAASSDAPLQRRLLRFVFGGLARSQRQQQQEEQLITDADAKQQRQSAARLAGAPSEASLCGCSEDDGVSEDVLGMSPFASCQDLQDYRLLLETRRAQRAAAAAAAAEAAAQQQRQKEAGPLRRVLQWVVRGVRAAGRHISPQGAGNNDTTMGERIFNVATSLPFVAVGIHSLRTGGPARRHFGASFVATGLIAGIYHATTGAVRAVFRKLDYYSIAYTSSVLRAATGTPVPLALSAAAALVTPLKPTLVTGANLAVIEARYLSSALRRPELRHAFTGHLGTAVTGIVCFLLEDILVLEMGAPPVFHSLWHTLSALSLGLIGPLLSHVEGALLLEGVQAVVTGAAA